MHHRRRCFGRHKQTVPQIEVIALEAALGHRRHLRQLCATLCAGHGEQFQTAGIHLGSDCRVVGQRHLRLVGNHRDHRRTAALIVDVVHLDLRHHLQRIAGDFAGGTGDGDIETALRFFCLGEKFTQGAGRQPAAGNQRHRRIGNFADGEKIALRIVGQFFVERGVDGVRAGIANGNHRAVGRTARAVVTTDDTVVT